MDTYTLSIEVHHFANKKITLTHFSSFVGGYRCVGLQLREQNSSNDCMFPINVQYYSVAFPFECASSLKVATMLAEGMEEQRDLLVMDSRCCEHLLDGAQIRHRVGRHFNRQGPSGVYSLRRRVNLCRTLRACSSLVSDEEEGTADRAPVAALTVPAPAFFTVLAMADDAGHDDYEGFQWIGEEAFYTSPRPLSSIRARHACS